MFYDDHRGRRILHEVDLDRDEFRYVLECGQEKQVFPTLRATVFCLVGCIDRNEQVNLARADCNQLNRLITTRKLVPVRGGKAGWKHSERAVDCGLIA